MERHHEELVLRNSKVGTSRCARCGKKWRLPEPYGGMRGRCTVPVDVVTAPVLMKQPLPQRMPLSLEVEEALRSLPDTDHPLDLAGDRERCRFVLKRLRATSQLLVELVLHDGAVKNLALDKEGYRVVSKAIEAARGPQRNKFASYIVDMIYSLIRSPHGSFVLQKFIEVSPASSVKLIVQLLKANYVSVAKHVFGSHICERLIEHCSEEHIGPLVEEVCTRAEHLAVHRRGNFVVQHLIEYGSLTTRKTVTDALLPVINKLAMHRIGAHVVRKMLEYLHDQCLNLVLQAILEAKTPCSLLEVACSRHGVPIVEMLLDLGNEALERRIRLRLLEGLSMLCRSQYGQPLIDKLDLPGLLGLDEDLAKPESMPEPMAACAA